MVLGSCKFTILTYTSPQERPLTDVHMPLQTYNVLTATIQPYIQKGLISDSKVLDIRGVDVSLCEVPSAIAMF